MFETDAENVVGAVIEIVLAFRALKVNKNRQQREGILLAAQIFVKEK